MCSAGFPLMSLTRMAIPSRMPRMPSWEMGFCSKYSVTNSEAKRRVRRYLVGRRSFSTIAKEKSRMSIRCRMIPLCKGVVSRSSLDNTRQYQDLVSCTSEPYLFLFPASLSPSTAELILPSAPSTTVSQLLWMSSQAALLRLLVLVSPLLLPAFPRTGPVERVP